MTYPADAFTTVVW